MPWSLGAAVTVTSLGNKRGVVVEVGRAGRYRVQVERMTIACREEDLSAPPDVPKRKKKSARPPREDSSATADESVPAGRVDLHGLRVEEALALVTREIDRSLLAGADRLEVIHGIGSGRIREALHRHLAGMSAVATFKVDPRNPGVTWVHF